MLRQDWTEVTPDVTLLSLYKLQLFFLFEINRSLQNMGPYTLHPGLEATSTGWHTAVITRICRYTEVRSTIVIIIMILMYVAP